MATVEAGLDGDLRLRAWTSCKHKRHARSERLPLVELRDERKKWEGDVIRTKFLEKGVFSVGPWDMCRMAEEVDVKIGFVG